MGTIARRTRTADVPDVSRLELKLSAIRAESVNFRWKLIESSFITPQLIVQTEAAPDSAVSFFRDLCFQIGSESASLYGERC